MFGMDNLARKDDQAYGYFETFEDMVIIGLGGCDFYVRRKSENQAK